MKVEEVPALGYAKQCSGIILAITGIYTRCIGLSYPNAAVFDEVHYGSVCSLYSKGQFVYDKQPPLFKLLMCSFLSEKYLKSDLWAYVGQEFSCDNDMFAVRIVPALFGVLLIPLVYYVVLALEFSHVSAFLAAFFVTIDNGLIVQSRMMVSDSFLHFLLLLSLLTALHKSTFLHICSYIFIGLAISTNTSSISTLFIILCLTLHKAFKICLNVHISLCYALLQASSYIVISVCLPVIIYMVVIMLHLFFVPFSGPHDILMSSSFQSSLIGGLKTGNVHVTYGSYVRLRATGDIPPYGLCYLYSKPQLYPLRYEDGLGSSAQQIVSCCSKPSKKESIWQIVYPGQSHNKNKIVRHGDTVWLLHRDTNTLLNTHNVAAPVSKHRQEVSCYVDHNNSSVSYFEWKINIINRLSEEDYWVNLHSKVSLLHTGTGALLGCSGASLSDWGGGCKEVVADPLDSMEPIVTVWNVETLPENCNKTSCNFSNKPISLSEMAIEYALKSWHLDHNSDDHRFSSEWHEWIFAQSNIAYWFNTEQNAQLLFVGNVASWSGGIIISCWFSIFYIYTAVCKQLSLSYHSDKFYHQIQFTLFTISSCWLFHVGYFVFNGAKPMFIYQYLPAVIYLHILQACAIEVFCSTVNLVTLSLVFFYLFAVSLCYYILRPLTYAFSNVSPFSIQSAQLSSNWEFLL